MRSDPVKNTEKHRKTVVAGGVGDGDLVWGG